MSGGNPQWPNRPQSPYRGRGQPPRPGSGWASPVPPRMTQSPPPFLIRPMVGNRGAPPTLGSPLSRTNSPFSPPPVPVWCPSPIPSSFGPRPFSPPVRPPSGGGASGGPPPPPPPHVFSPELRPSFDMEFIYPAGTEPDSQLRRQAMSIPQESVDEGPSTAEIIAAQSQDYVDERLAEYQATIQHLQDEQERVQKKTFVNWINSYLAKHVPPLHIVDLIEDFRDGIRLLALLEVLSGDRLPVERGRNCKRPHFLSNCNTALEFLQRKKIKLVNINSSDIVDGRPAVVLGLVWTIILYFQIEENTKVLASLGYRFGAPTPTPTHLDERPASSRSLESPQHGRATPSDKWRDGARKTLLAWVKDVAHKKFGVAVNDFGNSWRDGNAFLAIMNSIRPGVVDMNSLQSSSNRTRLETAFRVAETELGVTRLLDPEDVDVPRPDEKSIMTYVAQFLHKSNEPKLVDSFSALQSMYDELLTWLMQKTQFMEHMKQTGALPLSYSQYQAVYSEFEMKHEAYNRLKTIIESRSQVGITDEAWGTLQTLWRKLESQLKEWQWRLDAMLPDPFGGIGQWLAKAELLVTSDDVPSVMDDEAARVLNAKIEDHKAFFKQLPDVLSQFTGSLNSPAANQVPSEQLQSIAKRLHAISPLAAKRAVKLKFLEHKCCLVAFIILVENRLKQWTVKYGREEHVKLLLDQYNNFVNRNKIFQEFERAYIDMQHVIDEYKSEGGIDVRDGRVADHFLWEIGERWKSVSMELRCLQSMLEEVIAYWQRFDAIAPELNEWIDISLPMIQLPEEERMEYFQDVGVWHEKYQTLSDTITFLGATCDPSAIQDVKSNFAIIATKWESLFSHVKQYQFAGHMLRMRKDFLQTLSGLQKWLRSSEELLASPQPSNIEAAKNFQTALQNITNQIDGKDEEWRVINKKFQSLLPELAGDEVERLMKIIKKEKECLVKIRALVPQRQTQINQLLAQQESLEAGQKEITEWLSSAEVLMNSHSFTGGPIVVQQLLDKHRQFFAKTLYYKTMLEGKNKVVGGITRSGDKDQAEGILRSMKLLNDYFTRVEHNAQNWEQRLSECIRCWRNYDENKQTVIDWMSTAEKLLQERNLESKQTVEAHKNYFDQINDRPLRHMKQATHDLQQFLSPEEIDHINKTVAQLQAKYAKIIHLSPIHLAKLEFRLEEDNLASLLKEMDKEVANEHQQLNRKEDSQAVLVRHIAFFENGKVPTDAKNCLEKLLMMETRYTVHHPEDKSLYEQFSQAKQAFNTISERVNNFRVLLEEIPVQWNAYKTKYEEVVLWMDSVDASLKGILLESTNIAQFETEKAKFVEICREVDCKREDMKQLVQMLDTLVSRRADEEALKEQDQLEQLITRYKNLVPTIELTMIKTDLHSRCYTYREETQRIIHALLNVDHFSVEDSQPSSLEEAEALSAQQQNLLMQLEGQRTTIVSLLQKGKDLQKDSNAPAFIPDQVKLLDKTWNDTYSHANEKLKKVKGLQKVWIDYRSQRDEILQILGQAEAELKKIVPKHDPKQVAAELRAKQDMTVALRKATENMLRRLRELAQSLSAVATLEKAGILQQEVTEIEEKLQSMLDLLDDKVQQLGQCNEKWAALSENMEDMKNWMKGAQKALQQILSSDLSPEERLKKTKKLQHEIGVRMGMLQALEKEAQQLLAAESSSAGQHQPVPVENQIVLQHVDALKEELVNLHETVAVQNAQTSQTLAALEEVKAELNKVTPWLDSSEVKVAMGWTKPTVFKDAALLAKQLQEFSVECEAQHAKLAEAAKKGKLTKGSLPLPLDEMELALAKHAAISNDVNQNKNKMEALLKNWEKYDCSINKFQDWLSSAEKVVLKPLDRKMMTLPQLDNALTELKKLNKEISDHQSALIGITQECDAVAQNVSLDGATGLNSNLTKVKSRLQTLSNEVRGKLNYLSDSIIARQEFDAKVADFSNWIGRFEKKQESCDIYYDKLDSAMNQLHFALQEHGDHLGQYKELEEDAKIYQTGSIGTEQFEPLGEVLANRKKLVSEWIQISGWVSETNSALDYCQKQLHTPGIKKNKIHEIEQALENLGEKCVEWMPKAKKLDEVSKSSNLCVLDRSNSFPLLAEKLVMDTKQRIQKSQTASIELMQKSDKIGSQLEKLKGLDNELKKHYAELHTSLGSLKPEKCSLPALEETRNKLQKLVEKHAGVEGKKGELQRIGEELLRADPSSSKEQQKIVKDAGDEYEQLQHELHDKWASLVDTIDLWGKYNESKQAVDGIVRDGEKMVRPLINTQVPSNAATTASILNELKRAGDSLGKKKILVENCASLNQQLCSYLVPQVDTATLTGEIATIKGSYDTLAKSIESHIPKLETQLILWRNIEESKDDLLKWIKDTKSSLEEIQSGLGNSELARMKLGQYKDEVGDKVNAKDALVAKSNQLKKIGPVAIGPELDVIVQCLEDGFQGLANLSQQLDSNLGSFEEKEQGVKSFIKLNTDTLIRLKEAISKCEDRSGTPSDIIERLRILKQSKVGCDALKPKIEGVESQILSLRQEYPSWDNTNALNDLRTQKKRLNICESQVNLVSTALTAVLEKNFQDKYHSLAKIVHGLVEKIKWCDPSAVSDNFSLDAKKNCLKEVAEGIKESHEKIPPLQESFAVLKQIPEYSVKLNEHGKVLNSVLNDLSIVERNHQRMQGEFNDLAQLWENFDKDSDEVNAWLKDFEGIVRNETLNQINIPELQDKIKETSHVLKEIKNCEATLKNLNDTSDRILKLSPEARTSQTQTHLANRVAAVAKFITALAARLQNLNSNKVKFDQLLVESNNYIDFANGKIKSIDSSNSPHQVKLEELKQILEDKSGLALLNQTVEAGENVIAGVTTDSKESVRRNLRDLRDKWESHLDNGNAILKHLEAVQIQWSSFDESVNQIDKWLKDVSSKAEKLKLDALQPTLPDKKNLLQHQRALLQDLSSHTDIISSLQGKLSEFPDNSKRVEGFSKQHENLENSMRKSVSTSELHVSDHEQLEFLNDNFADWLKRLETELDGNVGDASESRLQSLEQLILQFPQGSALLAKCERQLATTLGQTHPSGHPQLKSKLSSLKQQFADFQANCKSSQEKLEKEFGKVSQFQKELDDLMGWVKQKEIQVKDPSLKSTVEAKATHLTKLEGIQAEIGEKEKEIQQILQDSVSLDSELQSAASELHSRYHSLSQPLQESISRYKNYLSSHTSFNTVSGEFLRWIDEMKMEGKDCNELTGDLPALQEKKQKLSSMMDKKTAKQVEMEALVDAGEKLYAQTSPDGREIIRQQIRTLRDGWETLGEQLQSSWQKLDACLSQFADFSSSQRELKKWLDGIESSIQLHTQLKGTLQEKRVQLQNHKIVNQEIVLHQLLVEGVCDRAAQLVDLTQDASLRSYIPSIQTLFQDIKGKSMDLLGKLEKCVTDHTELNTALRQYNDWKNTQIDRLTSLEDLSGEKSEIVRRLEGIDGIKQELGKGDQILENVEEIAGVVCLQTNDVGAKTIESEITIARDENDKLHADTEMVEKRLQSIMESWKKFDIGLQNYTKWFREMEAVFRSQTLQNTLQEKQEALQNFAKQRENVENFEKEVTGFLDQSHALLQISNAERIKPLVMQISNRYQLLHVLSKEVVNKWQAILDDHQAFETKFTEATSLLQTFEDNHARLLDEPNLQQRNSGMSALHTEKERLSQKISVLCQMGEKLFPDTGALGREKIRQDLRDLRDKLDGIQQELSELQKRQSNESQQCSNYQDSLQSTLTWLKAMEDAAAAGIEPPNWLSAPDTKSKLMKLKALLQDGISHRRLVEGLAEKADNLIQKNMGPNPDELRSTIGDIQSRYEALLNNILLSISSIEDTMILVQQWNDIAKKEQDWQKNLWEQLNLCTEYSGGKPALQSRLGKIEEIKRGFGEGEMLLGSLEGTLSSLEKKLPSTAKETLSKDLLNMRFEYDKLKNGLEEVRHTLQERFQQWGQYEDGFERLLVWLAESEGTLKAYSHCNTLEEKETQRSKYQDFTKVVESRDRLVQDFIHLADNVQQNLLKTLKDNEASFDKICLESSDLMQATGESRMVSNIQQITSRFQSIQMAAKEILKKCEQAVADHKSYKAKHAKFLDVLSELQDKVDSFKTLEGSSREALLSTISSMKQLEATRPLHLSTLNTVLDDGERLYPFTASEGREIIRTEMQELQTTFDSLYDGLATTQRDLEDKLSRWSGFEESKTKLQSWLNDMENQPLLKELVLHTTLDEKRNQLQQYRTLLHDILSHQQDVLELRNKVASLTEGADVEAKLAQSLNDRYTSLKTKATDFGEQYEAIVCSHTQYLKAVEDTTKWIDGTHSTVIMWSDDNQERINLNANLEKLKNLQLSFPEEEYRIEEIRSVAEKVIPGTIETGQANIRSQVDNSQQEWEALVSAINCSINDLVQKLKLWEDFESQKDACMNWLKETDAKLHAVDLQPSLGSKVDQLQALKLYQGEIKAKELELDAITDLASNLQRQVMSSKSSGVSASDLAIKYQQISHKIKELTSKWQDYVSVHQDFDAQIAHCSQWLDEIREKIAYCADLGAFSQKDLESKLGTIHDLLLVKDEGYVKIQNVVEMAQSVLVNTATTGHEEINDSVQKVQDAWSSLAAKMVDTKNQLDESIHKWAGFLEQIHQLRKTVDYFQTVLKDVTPFQSTIPEKKSQLDTIRNLEEKMVCERLEVESLKSKASEMMASGQQTHAAGQALEVLRNFDSVVDEIKKLLFEREAQFRDHKVYAESLEEITSWLTRTKEKIPSFKQRSLGDRLMDVESAGAMLNSLMNKKPQGVLLVEKLQQSGEVAMASSSSEGRATIKSEIKAASDSFEHLFNEIQQQKDNLDCTMSKLRDWKEEHERLSDWLQQCEILIKAAKNTLMGTLEDKRKQVDDVKDVMKTLETGSAQIKKFNEAAESLLASHLDNYVGNQLRKLNSRYEVQLNMGKDVLLKVEGNLEQHQQFIANYEKSQQWMERARQIIGECSVHSSSAASSEARKEKLLASLTRIQELVSRQEEGQNLVHNTVSWGEKSLRNTRSDGRDRINEHIKEIQKEWDRIVKKLTSTKVGLETAMLQWADYNTTVSQVSQLISDREAKLQKVAEKQPQKGRKRHPSASIGDRKATLRATNTIVQDIVSLEPMIESVTSKGENLMQESPASEISTKYQSLTKQAQEVYARQKEIVEQHQAFVDLATEFMNWMRGMKERLAKIAEPVGDKDILSNKIIQLKVLKSEQPEGHAKLEAALIKGSQACAIVDADDRELIEEEVAFLQGELDSFSEALTKSQQQLEVGLVRWKEWEDQYKDGEEWLSKTETKVKSFNKLQNSLVDKKTALEQFQSQLQSIFDWQKQLDKLNLQAQLLLETCADSRVSNAVTQMSTKFSALLSLSKEVIRRLEQQYQEHQQHSALYQECQGWIDRTREKLSHISDLNFNLDDVNSRLQSVKGLRQTLEQGQNKLRYALELKEKVMVATEPTGAAKIDEDTEVLKAEFDKLMTDIQDTRQKLAARASLLGELDKADKIIQDWLQEMEMKINVSEGHQYADLGEKRSSLEKLRGIEKEVVAQADMFHRLENKMAEDPQLPKEPYMPTFVRYEYIKTNLAGHIKRLEGIVKEHEEYWKQLNESIDYLRKQRLELQNFSDRNVSHKNDVAQKLHSMATFNDSLRKGEDLVKKTKVMGQKATVYTSSDGKDSINRECQQLQVELDSLFALHKDQQKLLKKCLESWDHFESLLENVDLSISSCEQKLKREPTEWEQATPEDLERCKMLMGEVSSVKIPLEDVADKCESLMELHALPVTIRQSTVALQSKYAALVSAVQSNLVKIQKCLTDHTDFLKEKQELEDWLNRAEGTVQDCAGFGTELATKDKLDTVTALSTRLTEGQHLLTVLQNAFARAIGMIPTDQQPSMRADVNALQNRWEKLNIDLKTTSSELKHACQRFDDFRENCGKFSVWCNHMEATLREKVTHKAELGDMKTLLERYKNLSSDIAGQKIELEALEVEADQLRMWSGSDSVKEPVVLFKGNWNKFDEIVKEMQKVLENEIAQYSDYHNSLQETEKWLLQTSFQLMAHNSLYITNREQTLEQLGLHKSLLDEILSYQQTLEDVKVKGNAQIDRYVVEHPHVKTTIEKQLKNVQDSYDSLLNTGQQIQKRLVESLGKFQEYEDALESIMQNLDKWEPEIAETLNAPIESIEESAKRLEYIRTTHNQLQGEKNRLSLAVQACEAATATLSRPTSPQEAILQPIPDKELAVRGRLEDLIDQQQVEVCEALNTSTDQNAMCAINKIDKICEQIQTCMSQLSSASMELERIRGDKAAIAKWVDDSMKKLKEIQTRNFKLRADTAQVEVNQLQDMRQGVTDKMIQLTEIELQESGIVQAKYLPELTSQLSSLDTEVSFVMDSRLDTHQKITDYRTYLANFQSWLDEKGSSFDRIEKGGGLTLSQKQDRAVQLSREIEGGAQKVNEVKSNAEVILPSLFNVDAQLVEEQLKSVERRYSEMLKRIGRKQQLLDTTLQSFQDFKNDSDQVAKEIATLLGEGDAKRGFEIGPMEEHHQILKSALKEIEGKQSTIDTLDRRLSSLQPELEDAEIAQAEAALSDVVKCHFAACDTLRKRLKELAEELGSKRKFLDKLQRAKSWVAKMEGELEEGQETIALNSSDVSKKIEMLKKHQGAIRDFSDGPLSEIKREADGIEKECSPQQKGELQSIVSTLESTKEQLRSNMGNLIDKFKDALQQREDFEKSFAKCSNWLHEAETALSSDLKGSSSSSIQGLEDQVVKYKKLHEDGILYTTEVSSLADKGKKLLPSLKEPDCQIVGDKIASLSLKIGSVTSSITDKLGQLQRAIKEFHQFSNIIEDAIKYTNEVKEKMNSLNLPVGSAIEDSQGLLGSYETLLDNLQIYRNKLDSLNLPSFARRSELQSVMKEQDDLISQIEQHIQRLRHLILLQQQYFTLTTEITNFIFKYTEIVGEVEKCGGPVEDKIKRYSDIISRIQECDAQLASAVDKGARIAEEGTISDRNAITEQLQNFKLQLHNLRRSAESKRAEHELANAEYKKYAAELDAIIAGLHERETAIRSRPLLALIASSVDDELKKHEALVEDVNEKLQQASLVEEALSAEEEQGRLPPSLVEKISENRLFLNTLPAELKERQKYLDENKLLRSQYDEIVASIESWIEEAKKRLLVGEGGLDFDNILANIAAHKNYFANEKIILVQVQMLRGHTDKIWSSLDPSEQENLRRKQDELTERIQNVFNSAKNYQGKLERMAIVWKNYLDLLAVVEDVIKKAEKKEDPATSLTSLRKSLFHIQSALNSLKSQQQELDNLNERSKSVEKEADLPNRQKIRSKVEVLNGKWLEAAADLEARKDALAKLVTQWEQCETLWQTFESGLTGIEEQFAQIDPSIRSQTQLQETKESIAALLERAKSLQNTHANLVQYAQFILNHLQYTSEICYSTLKSKLEHLSTQYMTVLQLLGEKLEWLNNQDAFLTEIDQNIEKLQGRVDDLDVKLQSVDPFQSDTHSINVQLQEIEKNVLLASKAIADFSKKVKDKFSSLKQVLPTSIGKCISNLEVDIERVASILEDKKQEIKRAVTTRQNFKQQLDAVNAWVVFAEEKLQMRSQEPNLLKENLLNLQTQLPGVVDQFENAQKYGAIIKENSINQNEKDDVNAALESTGSQLQQIKATIDERRQKISESLDSWQRFFQLFAHVMHWCDDKKALLADPLRTSSLAETRQKLNIYEIATKTLKSVNKQLSDMGKEIEKAAETTSTHPLTEKLEEVEHRKIEIEAQLLERNALLQETTEEWEQCERKIRETHQWLEKTKQALANPSGKRKPLRDQITGRYGTLQDVMVQRTKISLAVDKLQVHFKAGIAGDPNVAKEAADLQQTLNGFETDVKSQCSALEASVAEIDRLQEELSQLRNELGTAEQQLRHVCSPTHLPHDRDSAVAEQKNLKERVKGIQSKISARTERIKLLILQ